MTWLQKECIGLVIACLSVAGCSSTPEGGPSFGLDDLGNIVVTGINDAECIARARIKISSLENPIEFPAPQQAGLAVNVAVENGRVTIPVAPTSTGPVTVDDIVVEIPQGCAPIAGTFEYLGSSFELRPGENREVSWDDFEEE
jgi:hypothetical protein